MYNNFIIFTISKQIYPVLSFFVLVAMNIKQYTSCMCPYCQKTFAVEATFGSIELKTFSQEKESVEHQV